MNGLMLSLRSEFYKSRKTFGFWGAIIFPFVICTLVFLVLYSDNEKMVNQSPAMLWINLAIPVLGVMNLLLPIYTIFIAYSVNSIEHKAETWKTIFSLPISKWSVYTAKYLYVLFLVLICLLLFYSFTIGAGNLMSLLNPRLKFGEYDIKGTLFNIYFKLFMASLGIVSIQFLLSLLWSDFLKPMGVGFIATIAGLIFAGKQWKYAYLIPYSHPALTITGLLRAKATVKGVEIELFTKEICVSVIVAIVFFIGGYFIVQRRSVK